METAIKAYYGDQFLLQLGAPRPKRHAGSDTPECSYEWLRQITRPLPQFGNPLYHLLLIQFLGYDAERFFNDDIKPTPPFGPGPWPCLNPAADHYASLLINRVHISRAVYPSGFVIGEFACECGFAYRRSRALGWGKQDTHDDPFQYISITAYGPVWEQGFSEDWSKPEVSIRALSRKFRMYRMSILQHARRLGLPLPKPGGKSSKTEYQTTIRQAVQKESFEERRQRLRTALLEARRLNPAASRTMLGSMCPGIAWLYAHDREWLFDNLPPRQASNANPTKVRNKVQHDKDLAHRVGAVADRLRNQPGAPVWISRSRIAKEVGYAACRPTSASNLPMTAKALERVIETKEDYVIRRIQWLTTEGWDVARHGKLTEARLRHRTNARLWETSAGVLEGALAALRTLEQAAD